MPAGLAASGCVDRTVRIAAPVLDGNEHFCTSPDPPRIALHIATGQIVQTRLDAGPLLRWFASADPDTKTPKRTKD